MNYYQILGVREDADPDEIRSAYRRLVCHHHPDRSGVADAVQFRRIREAYETLSDPKARARYDHDLATRIPVRVVSSRRAESIYQHPMEVVYRRPASAIRIQVRPQRGRSGAYPWVEDLWDDTREDLQDGPWDDFRRWVEKLLGPLF